MLDTSEVEEFPPVWELTFCCACLVWSFSHLLSSNFPFVRYESWRLCWSEVRAPPSALLLPARFWQVDFAAFSRSGLLEGSGGEPPGNSQNHCGAAAAMPPTRLPSQSAAAPRPPSPMLSKISPSRSPMAAPAWSHK